MAWGGADEQRKEIEAGNTNAKDWHDEAMKTVEKTVEEYWNNVETQLQAMSTNSTHAATMTVRTHSSPSMTVTVVNSLKKQQYKSTPADGRKSFDVILLRYL